MHPAACKQHESIAQNITRCMLHAMRSPAWLRLLFTTDQFCGFCMQNRVLVLELQALVERYRMMDVEVSPVPATAMSAAATATCYCCCYPLLPLSSCFSFALPVCQRKTEVQRDATQCACIQLLRLAVRQSTACMSDVFMYTHCTACKLSNKHTKTSCSCHAAMCQTSMASPS